jgi:hypothetical protein
VLSTCLGVSAAQASEKVSWTLLPTERFYRDAAGPESVTRQFTVPALAGDFTLTLENGSAGGDSRISSAIIKVNGVTVVTTADLSQKVASLQKSLAGLVRKGSNTIEVEVRSMPSAYLTLTILGTYLLDVTLTAPAEGATLPPDRAMVQGTWAAYTPDVGILVNGVPAAVSGTTFVAADVPLRAGTNTLTAKITTFEGIADTAARQVACGGARPEVALTSNFSSGVAPLAVTFSAEYEGLTAVEYRFDLDGNGAPEIYSATGEAVSFTYFTPGLYYAAVAVVDSAGGLHAAERAILVESPQDVEPVLTGRWNANAAALRALNIEGALALFLPQSQGKFRDLFQTIQDQLPGVYSSLPAPVFVGVRDDTAQYLLVRPMEVDGVVQDFGFLIDFVRDENGLWRLRDY